jgi:tRNA threonylcarbamoyladenosine biosynthesis protein TsaE
MTVIRRTTLSREETFQLGFALAEQAEPGQVYCLNGDLGTGKTVFSQGFGAGLGVTEPVVSPTFTILKEYEEGRLPFYHFDVYRIGSEDEMDEIGYFDIVDGGQGVSLIEWSVLIEGILPKERIEVTIRKNPEKGFDYREIEIVYPDGMQVPALPDQKDR